VIEALIASDCEPSPSRVALPGEVSESAIGVSGTVTDAERDGYVTLVAVTVALELVTGSAAVYVVAAPLKVLTALKEPPPVTVHFAPALAGSPVTVAVKDCVAPPIIATGLAGAIESAGLNSVTVALADFVASALLVAVTVAVAAVIGEGAV
jgi:hypothetical protein